MPKYRSEGAYEIIWFVKKVYYPVHRSRGKGRTKKRVKYLSKKVYFSRQVPTGMVAS